MLIMLELRELNKNNVYMSTQKSNTLPLYLIQKSNSFEGNNNLTLCYIF